MIRWRAACTLSVVLLQALPAFAQAVKVTGTAVVLVPPAGFVPSARFPGFERADLQASIMVTEVPGPVAALTAGMTAAGLASRGMTLISSTRPRVDNTPALLLHVEQSASGVTFLKWMLVIGDTAKSVMIVGTFPKSAESDLSAAVKASLLSARWNASPAPDHFEGLPFRISATSTLKVAGRVSNMLLLTESGRLVQQDPDSALLAIGSSVAAVQIDDVKAFAERRAKQTKQLKNLRIVQGAATTVDGVAGHELIAEGIDSKTGKAVTLYQVIVPDSSGYVLMQGMVSATRAEVMIPEFRRVVSTFRKL